ncbi:carboxypeptidase A4-like [Amphibalanus amphitrite]|uniref:carboxypeptidase A4-like n=1 Tax=Amphibalanus amphitrite TaxID=1232801 RepID=UPI001C8FE07D|nr:carboxypeptidase A4-like [Amphibalanus amphitrite]
MGCRRGELPVLGAVLALGLLVGPRVLAQRADIELVPALSGDGGSGPVTYSGYQVLRVQVTGADTAELLRSYENNPGAHFWSESAVQEGPVDVMVSPDVGRRLKEELTRSGASYTVNIEDVQEAIKRENPSDLLQPRLQVRQSLQQGHPLTWRKYHRLADHHQYLDFVALRYGDLCETFSIGTSTEGRDIKGVKCGRGKREIWIDGGIHAREWISPAVVSYLIREFSERSPTSNDILSNFTLYIIPVLNPDGYEYSHTHDRMWRKTRSKNADSTCIGVDANRNFDISWGKSGTCRSRARSLTEGRTRSPSRRRGLYATLCSRTRINWRCLSPSTATRSCCLCRTPSQYRSRTTTTRCGRWPSAAWPPCAPPPDASSASRAPPRTTSCPASPTTGPRRWPACASPTRSSCATRARTASCCRPRRSSPAAARSPPP